MSFSALHWKTGYDTGVEEIDLQHRYFMNLINRLHGELATAADAEYRRKLFDELTKYASFHFVSEENLMLKFGYPEHGRHHELHRHLIDELSWRSQSKSEDELFDFLVRWFVGHTVEEDQRFGAFVRGVGVAPAEQG